jgi:hypothetical protein
MNTDDKEGAYCAVCGGISPGKVKTRQISIGGKEIGINKLDEILLDVRTLNLPNDGDIEVELVRRVKACNYVPTNRIKEYGEALLAIYHDGLK